MRMLMHINYDLSKRSNTAYAMTPGELTWEVKNVPAPAEVWELAKKNFLADKWWRGPDYADTPEGNKKYLKFYEGTAMQGKIALQPAQP